MFGFIGKFILMFFWVVLAMCLGQMFNLTQSQGGWLILAGIGLILFWGTLKKLVGDQYEDGRSHRNYNKRLASDLKAMEKRIQMTLREQQSGHNRTMELLQFRQQLLAMEAQENDAMVRAMIQTIDRAK